MYCLKLMLHCNLRTSIRFINISLRVARGAAMKTWAVVPFGKLPKVLRLGKVNVSKRVSCSRIEGETRITNDLITYQFYSDINPI